MVASVQELILAAKSKQKPSILSQLAEVGEAGLGGYAQGVKLGNTQSDTRLNIALDLVRRQQAEELAAKQQREAQERSVSIEEKIKQAHNAIDVNRVDRSKPAKFKDEVNRDENGLVTVKSSLDESASGTGMTPYQEYQVKKDQQEVNANQQTSAIYGTRAMQAQKQMEEIVSSGAYDPSSLGAAFSHALGKTDITNGLRSEGGQSYDQAADNLIAAILRKESGANITPQERTDAYRQYIIRPGDKPDVIAKKNINRETAIKGLLAGAKNAQPLPEDSGMSAMIDANDSGAKPAPHGQRVKQGGKVYEWNGSSYEEAR